MVSLDSIAGLLERYEGRYRWLDTLASDVDFSSHRLYPHGPDRYEIQLGARALDVELLRERSVARFSLAVGEATSGTTAVGAIVAGAFGEAARPKGPEGVVLGLLVGGLPGAAAAEVENPDETRVMTLEYQAATAEWRIYQGPYGSWAKYALSGSLG